MFDGKDTICTIEIPLTHSVHTLKRTTQFVELQLQRRPLAMENSWVSSTHYGGNKNSPS